MSGPLSTAALDLRVRSSWSRTLAVCGAGGRSCRVQQGDRLRSSAAPDTGNSSGSRRAAGRCGQSRRAYYRSTALRRPTRACTLPEGHSAAKPIPRCWSTSVKPEPTSPKGRKTAARVSNPSLNNFSPGNRAFGYRRVIALIGIAPIPNRRLRRTGIRGVIVTIVIAAVIGSRCERSPE